MQAVPAASRATRLRSGSRLHRDDQEVPLLVADDLGVVRDRAVPADVVAGTDLDDVVALGHPPSAAQDEVMFVAAVRVEACAPARLARPPRRSRCHGCHRRPPARCGRGSSRVWTGRSPARTTRGGGTSPMKNQATGTSRASPSRREAAQGRRRLVVLDLRQVAEVESASARRQPRGSGRVRLASDGPGLPRPAGAVLRRSCLLSGNRY